MIRATFALYRDALRDAFKAILRGPAGWVGSLLIAPMTGALAMTLGQIPLLGGFIVGFAGACFYGAYLNLVGVSLEQQKPMGWAILKDSLGHHFWEVIGVGFVAWIGSMAIQWLGLPGPAILAISLVCFVLFNPWPEIIYQERTSGTMDILTRAARWMSQNGPEWIIPHLVVGALVWGVWSHEADSILKLSGGILLHPWMVFRGALYRHLNRGSRRSRAWRSQF